MVIKVAYSRTPDIRYIPKRYPFPKQITKPGRGTHAKVKNKWTALKHVFQREMYTNWFGNTRFLFLVDVQKATQGRINLYNKQLLPLGFNMVRCKQANVVPLFNAMGCPELAHALRGSGVAPTMLVYAYGNEKSPIGNLETLPLLRKAFAVLNRSKKTPDDYVVAGMLDKQVLSVQRMQHLFAGKQAPLDYWKTIAGTIQAPAVSLPQMLCSPPQHLVNLLDFYAKSGDDSSDDSTAAELQTESEPTPENMEEPS